MAISEASPDEPAARASRSPWHAALPRGAALFVGAFSALNLAGDVLAPGFDANLWWIDLRPLPRLAARALLAVSSALLVAHGLRPAGAAAPGRRVAGFVATLFLLAVSAGNAVTAVVLRLAGRVAGASWVPFSLGVALVLSAVLVSLSEGDEAPARAGAWRVALVVLALAVLAPLGQMISFGRTDYRRPADVAVVFGARAYADGRPSPALRDRVVTAAALYRAGLVPRLLVSGGPGDGAAHETEVMRDLAISLGVPPRAIVRDPAGLDTRSTARTAAALCRAEGWCRVLAVSHGYHLARVKMSFARAGLAATYTVPSVDSLGAIRLRYMAREVAAMWFYYLTALPSRAP